MKWCVGNFGCRSPSFLLKMDRFTPADVSYSPPEYVPDAERVYLVPYRWLKEAGQMSVGDMEGDKGVLYTATPSSSFASPIQITNNIFSLDLVFSLRREEDFGQIRDREDRLSGCDYALIPENMWLRTLKWHNNSNAAMEGVGNCSFAGDGLMDVYPLQLRLSIMQEENQMIFKISKKDNAIDLYNRAHKIFSADSEPIHIWDFSRQTNLYFTYGLNRMPKDCLHQSDKEILLQLQVYGLAESVKCRIEGKKDDLIMQQPKTDASLFHGSIMNHDTIGNIGSDFVLGDFPAVSENTGEMGSLGLTGLQNLGNTCFMNSAIQCLVHTRMLAEYFLGDYSKEINEQNPLGMGGELALAFGDLLRKLWAPGRDPVAPRLFKMTLAHFAPQFSGFNQHDSQEFLAFLLDGLHEDLNRVKCRPYMEAKDANGRPDEEVGNEFWANHLARNDSVIVDLYQGQYRSTLVCPICSKVSVTFDPFMYLTLPLPSTIMRTMTVTVVSTDGSTQPRPYTITVPKNGKCKDLIQALSSACSIRSNESLLVAEIYCSRIIRYLEDQSDSLSLIRDDDQLVVYQMQNDLEEFPLVVFMHQLMEEHYINGKMASRWKTFGIPLVTRLCNIIDGSDICNLFLNLLSPFQRSKATEEQESISGWDDEDLELDDATYPPVSGCEEPLSKSEDNQQLEIELDFYITDEKDITKNSKIEMDKPVSLELSGQLHVLVCWPEKTIKQYNTDLLNLLPQIFRPGFSAKRLQESVSLCTCLEAFLKEEPLGPEDMWYCPNCKKHQQAIKKLDLWRLPEILVIHLKRFSYSQFLRNKLETFVDFPVHDLDLSAYIAHTNGRMPFQYTLYAVSNHYGGLRGGHYTANVHHQTDNQWYEFDDSYVFPVTEDKIKTSAAYLLFYRRVRDSRSNT